MLLIIFFLFYGILIGKYEIFPYNLLKIIQDKYQKHLLEKEFSSKDYKLERIESYIDVNVSNIEKTVETFLSIFDLIKLLLTNKKEDQTQHDHLLINEEIDLDERI